MNHTFPDQPSLTEMRQLVEAQREKITRMAARLKAEAVAARIDLRGELYEIESGLASLGEPITTLAAAQSAGSIVTRLLEIAAAAEKRLQGAGESEAERLNAEILKTRASTLKAWRSEVAAREESAQLERALATLRAEIGSNEAEAATIRAENLRNPAVARCSELRGEIDAITAKTTRVNRLCALVPAHGVMGSSR